MVLRWLRTWASGGSTSPVRRAHSRQGYFSIFKRRLFPYTCLSIGTVITRNQFFQNILNLLIENYVLQVYFTFSAPPPRCGRCPGRSWLRLVSAFWFRCKYLECSLSIKEDNLDVAYYIKSNFISIHNTYIQDPRAKDLGAQSLTQVFNKLNINKAGYE